MNNAVTAQKKAFDILKNEGVKELYHLDYDMLNMPYDALVDYVHPSDLGMQIYANAYEKMVREILNMKDGDEVTTRAVRQRREPATYEWMSRHAAIIDEVKTSGKKKALLGNSIFHQFGGVEGFSVQRAADVWNENFSDYINMGCGWDRIENLLWRVERGELDGADFEEVVIKIGTNNLSVKHSDSDILEGLNKLVKTIHLRQPKAKIIVCGILPRRDMETKIKNLNIKIRSLMSKLEYTSYKDLSSAVLLPSGKIDEKKFVDGLHPNNTGYKAVANILKK